MLGGYLAFAVIGPTCCFAEAIRDRAHPARGVIGIVPGADDYAVIFPGHRRAGAVAIVGVLDCLDVREEPRTEIGGNGVDFAVRIVGVRVDRDVVRAAGERIVVIVSESLGRWSRNGRHAVFCVVADIRRGSAPVRHLADSTEIVVALVCRGTVRVGRTQEFSGGAKAEIRAVCASVQEPCQVSVSIIVPVELPARRA
jgi:hypothetical protein